LKKLGESRNYRSERGQFLCDGIKLLEEAVGYGATIHDVLTTSGIEIPVPPETRVYKVGQDLLDSISPLKNAQDILFSCAIPNEPDSVIKSGTHILLDRLQDPGNVGTIIRTANAFGVSSVILIENCADPYNPKAVRASMGAVFRQTIRNMSIMDISERFEKKRTDSGFSACIGSEIKLLGASTDPGSKSVLDVDLNDSIIAIGSEGGGLSMQIAGLCDEMLTIPMAPGCESVNAAVAAAIIMWEARRGKLKVESR